MKVTITIWGRADILSKKMFVSDKTKIESTMSDCRVNTGTPKSFYSGFFEVSYNSTVWLQGEEIQFYKS